MPAFISVSSTAFIKLPAAPIPGDGGGLDIVFKGSSSIRNCSHIQFSEACVLEQVRKRRLHRPHPPPSLSLALSLSGSLSLALSSCLSRFLIIGKEAACAATMFLAHQERVVGVSIIFASPLPLGRLRLQWPSHGAYHRDLVSALLEDLLLRHSLEVENPKAREGPCLLLQLSGDQICPPHSRPERALS